MRCARAWGKIASTGWLFLFLLLAPHAQAAEQRIALVIGNGAYSSAPLANPISDARLMAKTLRGLGFQVTLKENADQSAMKHAVRDFGDRLTAAGSDSVGLFYYSGHGAQAQDRTYLIPVGAQIGRESDFDLEALDAQSILDQMRDAGSGVNLVILDACRDNPFASGSKSLTKGLSRLDAPAGSLIAYATAPGKTAVDGDGQNSPYTKALAQLLPTPGLSVTELFQKVRVQVLHDTSNHQMPWESSSLIREVYMRAGEAPAQVAQLDLPIVPAPAPVAPSPPSNSLAAMTPGTVFRDCDDCMAMVRLPTGSFQMGSPSGEQGQFNDEGPVHGVSIRYPFAVGQYPVTRGQWRQYLKEAGKAGSDNCYGYNDNFDWFEQKHEYNWQNTSYPQADDHPVVCVKWSEAKAYAEWYSRRTGQHYRLLTEAEYEYANRAGSTTIYFWGNDADAVCGYANGIDASRKKRHQDWTGVADCDDGFEFTSPVGSFKPNAFGLYDMTGNVNEWVEDCYNSSYTGAPIDGRAWTSGNCSIRISRGGDWNGFPRFLRAAHRVSSDAAIAGASDGFRLARTE